MKISKDLVDYDSPKSFGNKLRKKRAVLITSLIEDAHRRYGKCRILDVGGTHVYWNIFSHKWLREHKVTITLLNLSAAPVPQDATDLFESLAGDACNLSQYKDGEFDFVHSNSVIEHVGRWSDMGAMASEATRVGKFYYHQTPYFWFPIEPHFLFPFLHWMPMSLRVKIAQKMALGTWPKAGSVDKAIYSQNSAVLLDKSMMQTLFPDATLQFERLFGLPKSIIVYRRPKDVRQTPV